MGLAALAAVCLVPAAAADGNIFTIAGIAVDESAADTRVARSDAVGDGVVKAWRELARRLVVGDAAAVARPGTAVLESLVRGLEIDDEKISPGRYRALLTVRFHAPGVFDLLAEAGVPFLETPSPVLLVVPVWQSGDGILLWEDTNMWLAAWRQVSGSGRVVETVVPRGDLRDIVLLDAPGALSGDWNDVTDLASRYRADGVLVAHATENSGHFRQRLVWLAAGGSTPVLMAAGTPYAWPSGAFREAALETLTSLDEHWTAKTLAPGGPRNTALADVPVASLGAWVDIRRRMESSPVFHEITPLSISTTRIRLRLGFTGTRGDLFFRLRREGLDVDDRAGILTITRL